MQTSCGEQHEVGQRQERAIVAAVRWSELASPRWAVKNEFFGANNCTLCMDNE